MSQANTNINNVLPINGNIINYDGLTIIDDLNNTDIINNIIKIYRNITPGFVFCFEGEFKCKVNMTEYHLTSNDILFIQRNSILEVFFEKKNADIKAFFVNNDYNPIGVAMKEYMALYKATIQNPKIHVDNKLISKIKNIIVEIEEVLKNKHNIYTTDYVKAYLKELYVLVAIAADMHITDHKTHRTPQSLVVLHKFLDLLEQNFATQRDIEFYANKLDLVPKYVTQVIKKASGKLASDWIQERVILEAKLMLIDGNHNVQQVSEALHFSSQSFFGKYFKKAVGISPKQYVMANRK